MNTRVKISGEIRRIESPFVFTIFGASGDLAKLKIFPSLFELAEQKRFRSDYAIIGFSRSDISHEGFREDFAKAVKEAFSDTWDDRRENILKEMLDHVWYYQGQYDHKDSYLGYKAFRTEIMDGKTAEEVFYFSVPPSVFEPIIENLKYVEEDGHKIRMVMEKPFGNDEEGALHLFHFIGERFHQDQIFLLDHYLGKKTVRSILPLRSSNRLLQSVINGREIANIQINALENFGVGQRLGYFEHVGIVKDMLQSHLLQLLSLLTMSVPVDQTSYAIHQEKQAVINSLYFEPEAKNLCLGQYEGYRAYEDAVKESKTPTFAAVRLYFNRQEWYHVPIFLRAGKMLDRRHTYMVIELEKQPYQDNEPNRIVIEMAPNQEIKLTIVDEDDHSQEVNTIKSSGSLACQGDYCLPEHALLLLDVLANERHHFLSFPEIIGSWKIIDDILNFAGSTDIYPEIYKPHSHGPESQDKLMHDTHFHWYDAK